MTLEELVYTYRDNENMWYTLMVEECTEEYTSNCAIVLYFGSNELIAENICTRTRNAIASYMKRPNDNRLG